MKIYKQSLPNHAQSNFYSIFPNIFAILGISFTYTYLNTKLLVSTISLDSIQNILQAYLLSSLPVHLSITELQEIPYPALAQIRNKDGDFFVVLQKIEKETITYIHTEKGIITEDITNFEKIWSGVTLLIEKNEKSAEPNYKENKKQEIIENLRLPLLLLVLGLVIGYQAMQFTNLVSFAWLATKLVGTVLSILLLLQSLNKNSVAAKLCSFNKKTDCNSLLTSAAATLFGVVSLAEIGFFYFAGGLIVVLLAPQGLEALVGLKLLAYLSLPFVLWSVWYQWKVAKIWCPLCLGVAGVLVVESLNPTPTPPLLGGAFDLIASAPLPIGEGLGVGLLISLYFFLKPFFIFANQVPVLQKNIALFKQNVDIFTNLLQAQKSIDLSIVPQDSVLGDANAPVSLVFVTNPSCKPCQLAKPKVDTLLAQFEEELKVIMIDTKTHSTWCNENHITHTPTFFVQGKQLPDLYRVEDLAYFVGEMAEEVVN
jgi:uncharacterized membrane protein